MTRASFEVEMLDTSHRADLDNAAAVAARAFGFDPFFVYLSPRPLLRSRGLALFWRSEMAGAASRGEISCARQDGRILGVATWIRPGGYPLPASSQLRQAAGALRALIPDPLALVRGSQYLVAMEKAHPHELHWYLLLLATDPEAQRNGIGTALQEPVLERADAEGLPAYLETQKPDNIAYYGRFGYEVVEELRPVAGGPPIWTMRRPPRG